MTIHVQRRGRVCMTHHACNQGDSCMHLHDMSQALVQSSAVFQAQPNASPCTFSLTVAKPISMFVEPHSKWICSTATSLSGLSTNSTCCTRCTWTNGSTCSHLTQVGPVSCPRAKACEEVLHSVLPNILVRDFMNSLSHWLCIRRHRAAVVQHPVHVRHVIGHRALSSAGWGNRAW